MESQRLAQVKTASLNLKPTINRLIYFEIGFLNLLNVNCKIQSAEFAACREIQLWKVSCCFSCALHAEGAEAAVHV